MIFLSDEINVYLVVGIVSYQKPLSVPLRLTALIKNYAMCCLPPHPHPPPPQRKEI